MRVDFLTLVILATVLGRQVDAEELRPEFGVSATFSIVAVDPVTGTCGAAVASKYPSVGRVVPFVRAGVGAFCTQHWHHPPWGDEALDLLEAGHGSEQVLGMLLKDDERRDKRQLAIIDMQGRAANRNPSDAAPAGSYWGAMSGRFYACQGNTLAGREVVVAMAQAYEETEGSLTDRLMAALVAADRAGGDHRGRLAAGIRVAKTGHDGHWFELYVDESDDAVNDLLKKYEEIEHEAKGGVTFQAAAPATRLRETSEPPIQVAALESTDPTNGFNAPSSHPRRLLPCVERRSGGNVWRRWFPHRSQPR